MTFGVRIDLTVSLTIEQESTFLIYSWKPWVTRCASNSPRTQIQ